jgi:hypothetical protein
MLSSTIRHLVTQVELTDTSSWYHHEDIDQHASMSRFERALERTVFLTPGTLAVTRTLFHTARTHARSPGSHARMLILRVSLCSPNEDFGRPDRPVVRVSCGSTFQRFVAQIEYSPHRHVFIMTCRQTMVASKKSRKFTPRRLQIEYSHP